MASSLLSPPADTTPAASALLGVSSAGAGNHRNSKTPVMGSSRLLLPARYILALSAKITGLCAGAVTTTVKRTLRTGSSRTSSQAVFTPVAFVPTKSVACWGGNWRGQSDPPDGEFVSMTAGWAHSCGIRTDQTVVCWGNNDDGQAEAPEGEFVSIAAGEVHTCGILASQTISCWGSDYVGQTNAPGGSFVAIEAGAKHSCAIEVGGAVACWGYSGDGQTNPPGGGFETVTAGREHSCGTRTDGSIACWGANHSGESEAPEGQYVTVSAGKGFSCGLRTNGTVSCWGRQLVVPGPVDLNHFSSLDRVDPSMCRPLGTDGTTAGFPLPHWAAPAVGKIRVAVLFVDFDNAEATHSTHQEAELGLPYMSEYLRVVSYQQLEPEFDR